MSSRWPPFLSEWRATKRYLLCELVSLKRKLYFSTTASEIKFYYAVPLITSDIVIVKRHETNSLTLSYTPTPSSISRFNSYRFSLTDSTKKTNVKEKTVDDPDRKVIFDDLVPGRLYEISGKHEQILVLTFSYLPNGICAIFSMDCVGWSYLSSRPKASSTISRTGICYQCKGHKWHRIDSLLESPTRRLEFFWGFTRPLVELYFIF